MDAESAYLFRHALLRDAAYGLQTPGDRARLHELAFYLIEGAFGGRAQALAPLDARDPGVISRHGTDAVAHELVEHANLALTHTPSPELNAARTTYLHRAAEHAARNLFIGRAIALWVQLADRLDGAARAEAMRRAGALCDQAGMVADAERHLAAARDVARDSGNRHIEGEVTASLAGFLVHSGRLEQGLREFERALELHRESGAGCSEGSTTCSIAIVHQSMGNLELADELYRKGLAIHEARGDRRYVAGHLANLSSLYHMTGRDADAERVSRQAIGIARGLNEPRIEGLGLANLGVCLLDTGRYEEAEQALGEALTLWRKVGDRRMQGITTGNLAALNRSTGRDHESERLYRAAIAIHREISNWRSEARALINLGSIAFDRGEFARSLALCDEGLALVHDRKAPEIEGLGLCRRATVLVLAERREEARANWLDGADKLRSAGESASLAREQGGMREICARAGVPPLDDDGR